MIIGNLHTEFTIIAARERLCAHAKSIGSPCHGSVLPAVYRAVLAHSVAHHHPRRPPPDHSQDAILYVTVVIVFYAAIILLLVGTNLRRRKSRKRSPPTQIVVYDQKRGNIENKIAVRGSQRLPAVHGITQV